ncbi:MAG: NAD-dependent epimerase/dehydratase family protein, partial [Gemmataceae bacterium]
MIADIDHLETRLSEPTPAAVAALAAAPGDILLLGVGGKMGPTLARMARRAADLAGNPRRVIGVSRFTDAPAEARLNTHGVETVRADLLDFDRLRDLPDAPNVIFMAGMKFGSTVAPALTWAMNVLLPARVAERYPAARLVAFSTGNVYGLTPVAHGGSLESDAPHPVGEYAMTALGRERAIEYAARGPTAIVRLNYACEMRYGVLVDVARAVWEGRPVDVTTGHFNAIWQADANAVALACLAHASSPPLVLNLAGPELLSVRQVAAEFGRLFGKAPVITGVEGPVAFLSNAQRCVRAFGYPRVGV